MKNVTKPIAIILTVAGLALLPSRASATNDGLASTPPMGWNCYHWFGTMPDENMIKHAADGIVSSGLKDAGYIYLNMDDGWMTKSRDTNGNLVANPKRFPHGLKALTDYIHTKGLKAGIYLTCGQETYQHLPGSLGHETNDADQIAAWGFDFLKYDYSTMTNDPPRNCKAENIAMSKALRNTGRPILFSMCEHGRSQPWTWAADYADMWRISTDIKDCWDGEFKGGWGFNKIINDKDAAIASYAGPGHWNDPDIMIVGLHGRQTWMGPGCTDTEYRSHYSLWCLLAAPLMLGVDPNNMTTNTTSTVMNPEIIAVNQDALGKQAQQVGSITNLDVWVKPLQGNAWAVGLYNRSETSADITVHWTDLGLPSTANAQIRDLWAKRDLGSCADHYTGTVAPHECVVLKISPPAGDNKAEAKKQQIDTQ
jgi:alpha-galactosidase